MSNGQAKGWISSFSKHKTMVIAEAGVNHNGDMALARNLIDAAAAAGADFVKFQTFKTELLVTPEAKKAPYQEANSSAVETQFAMLKKLELTRQNHLELMAHCQAADIGFLSTPFDSESVDLLENLGLPLFKIPSGEITNLPLLQQIGGLKKFVLLSTGMATIVEVEAALNVLQKAGTPRSRICVLHCTSQYPAPFAELNLRAILTLQEMLGVEIGYSDHTLGTEVAIAAVSLGARVIEKHFTLNRNLPGPDHKASLEPADLAALITSIRNIEVALGDGNKQPTASESQNLVAARKSIYIAKPITSGEVISTEYLAFKRPGNGLSPMLLPDVLGKKAACNMSPGHLLTLQDVTE